MVEVLETPLGYEDLLKIFKILPAPNSLEIIMGMSSHSREQIEEVLKNTDCRAKLMSGSSLYLECNVSIGFESKKDFLKFYKQFIEEGAQSLKNVEEGKIEETKSELVIHEIKRIHWEVEDVGISYDGHHLTLSDYSINKFNAEKVMKYASKIVRTLKGEKLFTNVEIGRPNR